MGLTETLSHEHRYVLEKLSLLESSLRPISVSHIEEVLQFFETELPVHRRKEEEVLFPRLAEADDVEPELLAHLLEDHHREKELLDDLRHALLAHKQGEDESEAIRSAAAGVVDLLRSHIDKEDNVLFPMVDRAIGPDEAETVARLLGEIGTFSIRR